AIPKRWFNKEWQDNPDFDTNVRESPFLLIDRFMKAKSARAYRLDKVTFPSAPYTNAVGTGIAATSIVPVTNKDQRRKKNRYNEMSVLSKSINVAACGNPAMHDIVMTALQDMSMQVAQIQGLTREPVEDNA
ncbi:hypothetical protein BGZ89_008421, partial [Linnemannia elongata]